MQAELFTITEKNLRMKPIRALISGGGTGGHIFPAVAIANELKRRNPEAVIEFVGAKGKMEMEKVPASGYKIHALWISGLQRSLDARNLLLPLKVLSSLWKAYRLVKKFKPDVTVGVGGYASGPLNYMASKMGVPLLLQEQNSFPGLTNKLLRNYAAKICVAYPNMDKYFNADKLVVTGNPIRQDIITQSASKEEALKSFKLASNKKTILIIGGSLGARTINQALDAYMPNWNREDVQLLWQTGASYTGEQGSFSWGTKTEFIKQMDLAYKAADIVISRAGALSISELAAVGKATVFVPLPSAAEDHQTKNAKQLVDADAAMLCLDRNAESELVNMALTLLDNEAKCKQFEEKIKTFARPNAAKEIVDQLLSIIE